MCPCPWPLLWAAAGGGRDLSRLGFCSFSLCLQPDVCFVLKSLFLLTVLMRTWKAGQWRVQKLIAQIQLRGGGNLSIIWRQRLFLQAHSVIQAFISCLLEMVVENGGQTTSAQESSSLSPLLGSWAGRQWGGVETMACLSRGQCFSLSMEMEAGPPSASRSGNAHSLAGQLPASLHQMDHTSHFHKHTSLPLINRRQ